MLLEAVATMKIHTTDNLLALVLPSDLVGQKLALVSSSTVDTEFDRCLSATSSLEGRLVVISS